MVSFPSCKINLGLHVLEKRADGFHEIETCLHPVAWTDVLEVLPSQENRFTYTGLSLPGNTNDNLCQRAYELLKSEVSVPNIQLHLHKVIPFGAGLGGGSSDAAATLVLLNNKFELNVSPERMQHLAARLGSDVPFFLRPSPAIATGRGEIMKPVHLGLSGKFICIVYPNFPVDTREAYRGVVPAVPKFKLEEILSRPVSEWKGVLSNDFEPSIFRHHPQLAEIKARLYTLGASYASMSGSGSSVFALFDSPLDASSEFPSMTVWSGRLG